MKNTIKKILLPIALISAISTNSFAFLTFDEATVEQQLLQLAQEKLIKTATQDTEINTDKTEKHTQDQLDASTGIRVAEDFINKLDELSGYLQEYNLDIMDLEMDITGTAKSQIGQYAKQLFEKFELFDDCAYDYMNDDQKRICKNRMVRKVQELSTFQTYSKEIKQLSQKLDGLVSKLAGSEDLKETADISASIQAQSAVLELKRTQMDMMIAQNKAKADVDARQKEQMYKKSRLNIYDWK